MFISIVAIGIIITCASKILWACEACNTNKGQCNMADSLAGLIWLHTRHVHVTEIKYNLVKNQENN
jgi:hypothetical protein